LFIKPWKRRQGNKGKQQKKENHYCYNNSLQDDPVPPAVKAGKKLLFCPNKGIRIEEEE